MEANCATKKTTLEHTLETETHCHSKPIVVRNDSDPLQLQPAFKDLTGKEAVLDLKTPSVKERLQGACGQ